MILFLSEEHKNHLSMLHPLALPVLVDFCKLSFDFLQNGANSKKYNIASQKLQVETRAIENVVHALAFLLVEACKYNLSENDFRMSLSIAGFSVEHQDILMKFYNSKKTDLSEALHKLQDPVPTYQDLDWRFEVQIASRSSEEVKPKVTMDLVLKTPKSMSDDKDFDAHSQNTDSGFDTPPSDTTQPQRSHLTVNQSIRDARTASECENVIKHVLLECDLPNLLNMTSKLEQALQESKSQHVRKLQRALQRK